MARASALLAGLCAILTAQLALADPTTALMSQIKTKRDPPGCGEPYSRCCVNAATKCNSAQLVCASVEGPQSLKCWPCGDDGMPACGDGSCSDSSLLAVDVPGRLFKTCVNAPPPVVPATANVDPNPKGPAKDAPGRIRAEKLRKDDEAGRQMRGVGCGKAGATKCRGGSYCQSGVCLRCGGRGKPCCPTGNPCRSLGGKKGLQLQCVADAGAGLGTNVCKLPENAQTI